MQTELPSMIGDHYLSEKNNFNLIIVKNAQVI